MAMLMKSHLLTRLHVAIQENRPVVPAVLTMLCAAAVVLMLLTDYNHTWT